MPVRPALVLAVTAAMALTACAADPVTPAADASGAGTSAAGVTPELAGALQEVGRLAPALESALRGTDYPDDLAGALAAVDEAGLDVADGYAVAGYAYDAAAVEFELCVAHTASGAWATYDTAPMSLREQGEDGGCPG